LESPVMQPPIQKRPSGTHAVGSTKLDKHSETQATATKREPSHERPSRRTSFERHSRKSSIERNDSRKTSIGTKSPSLEKLDGDGDGNKGPLMTQIPSSDSISSQGRKKRREKNVARMGSTTGNLTRPPKLRRARVPPPIETKEKKLATWSDGPAAQPRLPTPPAKPRKKFGVYGR